MSSERDDDEQSPKKPAPSARVLALRAELLYLRHELQALLDGLDTASEPVETSSAVVTAVVAKTALLHHPLRRA